MVDKVPQSKADLEKQLSDHLGFLRSSALAYDNGCQSEAKRLAVSLRLLLHDSSNSKSLLGQLGKKNILFLDTCRPFNPNNLVTFSGLVMQRIGANEGHFVPHLDNLPPSIVPHMISFKEWWNALIIMDKDGNKMSRKDIILTVCDQDGGTHVDPKLNEAYANLSRDNSLGFTFFNQEGKQPIGGAELASVRQIAYEVIKTIESITNTKRKRHRKKRE